MTIKAYQKRCFKNYKKSIGLPDNYHFLYGNPINVQVPIETAQNGVMIVGAYPSAKFYTVGNITNVPLVDNDAPFSYESYFDGSCVRNIPSGKELEQSYLIPLGISREQCWITDLVKVFLFKKGHINQYIKLGEDNIPVNRSRFRQYAKKSIVWLEEEIKLASPKVMILLGQDVTSIVFDVSKDKAKKYLDGSVRELWAEDNHYPAICLPHPGIIMKPHPKNPWPDRFNKVIIPKARNELRMIGI